MTVVAHLSHRGDAMSLSHVDDRGPRDMPPPASAHDADTPFGVWGLARRHLLLIGVCSLVAGASAIAITARIAPTYLSTATIRIDEKSSQLPALDALGLWQGNAVATELGILRSRALAEEVVDTLGLQLAIRRPASVRRADVFSYVHGDPAALAASYRLEQADGGAFRLILLGGGQPTRVIRPGERVIGKGFELELAPAAHAYATVDFDILTQRTAVDRLQASLQISRRDKDADLVDVSDKGTDAALTSEVVNLLSRRFVARRQEERHAEARIMVRFLDEQIHRVSDQLAASELALRTFRDREHVISLPDEASTGVSRQAELRAQRNTLEAERSALQRLLNWARRSGTGPTRSPYRDLLAFPTILRSGTAAALLAPLTAAEGERNALLGRRTTGDPDVQVLDARIAQLHAQIESLVGTYLEGLTNQVASLDTLLASSDARLRSIPSKEIQLAELDRDAKSSETIYSMLQNRLEEAQIAEAASDPSVRMVDAAVVPLKPVSPKPMINLALALIAGAIAGLAGAGTRELSDRSLHTRRDLLAAARVPVVGVVPHVEPEKKLFRLLRRGRGHEHELTTAHAFSWLAANLVHVRAAVPIKSLVITSALPGDGKTTVALNLSSTLARHGRRVLLIDADLRGGRIAKALGVPAKPGLSETLAGEFPVEAAVRCIAIADGVEMSVISSGAIPVNPSKLLASERTRDLLEWARANYDIVIIDSSPTNVAADAAIVAPRSDGVLFVARAGVTERGAIELAMEQLALVDARVVGAVLNDVDLRRDGAYDRSYQYYSRYNASVADRVRLPF
ncbi:MAG: GumC family protein [Gemmatimonadaceae bacterium]